MKTKNLVYIEKQNVFTNSLLISEGVNLDHKVVIRLVRKYKIEFESLGFLNFQSSKNRGKQGLKTEYSELNEDQATFLMTLFRNTEIVVAFKLRLVKEFRKAINELSRIREQRLTFDWQDARANSKCIRGTLTQVVQAFERLAAKQGGVKIDKEGKEGRRYYETITKMIYKQLFGDGSLKNIRDQLDSLKLQFLSICEHACAEEIEKLVELEIEYHEIYKEAKKRVIATVEGLSASKLTGAGSVVKLAWDNS